MKLSKEELYRLHHFFLPLDEFFLLFFGALALLSFSSEEKEFFFFFRSCARKEGKKFLPRVLPTRSSVHPQSLLPPLVLLPTPCESSFRSIEEDEIIGCAREERALASNYFVVVVVVVCRQMRLTRAAGPYFFAVGQFLQQEYLEAVVVVRMMTMITACDGQKSRLMCWLEIK